MENVYNFRKHSHCVIIHISKVDVSTYIFSTLNRHFVFPDFDEVKLGSSITYNKQKTDVTGVGWNFKEGKVDIVIDDFRDRLYHLFKKDKETWDEEDMFLMKAVSDYLPVAVKNTMGIIELDSENFDLFHYAFIVPSEWEEEIRDDIIRPIFVQSGLISNEDHQDRLLFFTDIESICYNYPFERGQNTILCRLLPEKKKAIIKFDLIQTMAALFGFPNAKFFPKVINSRSVSVTYDDVQGCIKNFLRENLSSSTTTDDGGIRKLLKSFFSDQDQIIETVLKRINIWSFLSLDEEKEDLNLKRKPWVDTYEDWMLSEFINSLHPSIICSKLVTFLLGYMKDIISNNFVKGYRFLLVTDSYSDCDYGLEDSVRWLEYILEYNRRSLNSIVTITRIDPREDNIGTKSILGGAGIGVFEAIQHSDIYCKPHIVSSVDLTTSSSVFLNSKPDAILNLDISLGATLFTCFLLDEYGFIQQILDHNYFIRDKDLPPLGHFYSFSNTITLNVKGQFISFADKYLLGDLSTVDTIVFIKKDIFLEIKSILTKDLSRGEVLVSTSKKRYIKAFILLYIVYIKEEILHNLPSLLISDQMEMKIGYDVSIEAILLNNTIESKDSLRDIIFVSGLVPKNDISKKLRVTTHGERSLPAIQKSLRLELSLKSYFLLCQLHEDYIQLSLHQVVTASRSEAKDQESIIVQDKILNIQNIYDSLCSNMWCNLLKDNSLIDLCEMHNTSDNNKNLDLFSPKTKTEFFANLKGHILNNVLQNSSSMQSTNAINLTSSCNCKICLTTSDIVDISFTPVLQDIAHTLSASLLNKNLFGNYMNVDYLFSIIHFNNNPKLQYAFSRILEEEADDFNLELGIETSCLVVPELFSELLQPVIAQRPFCYKDFKIGALQQVCSENYVFCITQKQDSGVCPIYKSKITDSETIKCNYNIVFPFLNKGKVIDNIRSDRNFYLRNYKQWAFDMFQINIFIFKTMNYLENDETMNYLENNETLSLRDNIYQHVDKAKVELYNIFKWKDVNVPVMTSVSYVSYTSSLQFSVRLVGVDTRDENLVGVIEAGEPLTLTRL